MSDEVIFRELPATFPEKDKYRKPSIISSLLFHGLLIIIVIIVPMVIRETISEEQLLITLVSPLPPPPGPPVALPAPQAVAAAPQPKPVKPEAETSTPVLITPTEVPKDIARIVDEPMVPSTAVVGGVPGGLPGGAVGGVLGGMLSSRADLPVAPSPPPAPPSTPPSVAAAPAVPVRIGGSFKEPRLLKAVPPVYPMLAAKARVTGRVVLEATLTAEGTVEEIHVISGHLLLIQPAIDAVKQWQYEPTTLNGVPIPVILTVKVNFTPAS